MLILLNSVGTALLIGVVGGALRMGVKIGIRASRVGRDAARRSGAMAMAFRSEEIYEPAILDAFDGQVVLLTRAERQYLEGLDVADWKNPETVALLSRVWHEQSERAA